MSQEHDWLIPSPLWSTNGFRQVDFYRPALFEFRSDDFMEEFLAAAAAPASPVLKDARLQPTLNNVPNKLFQPAHGCFYLAAASLCCRAPGFPDRQVRQAEQERAAFVLRKIVGGKEYAWIVQGRDKSWKPTNGTARTLLADEERLPVFPIPLGSGRQLYCGYVPAASSDTYKSLPSEVAGEDEAVEDPVEELGSRFTAAITRDEISGESLLDGLPDEIAWTTSVYLLVELWEFLQKYLADVSVALAALPTATTFDDKAQEKSALLTFLQTKLYKGTLTLAAALKAVAAAVEALNAPGGGNLVALGFSQAAYSLKGSAQPTNQTLLELLDRVRDALPDELPRLEVPKFDVSTEVQYVLRFVYERQQCDPVIVEVSLPSQPFTFAPFFDADAPSRSIRIPLPSDVSIAGLRKYNKGVTFMMSNAMRKKMQSVLGKEPTFLSDNPDPNDEDGETFAFICSFSIQIIFIIAFMLLLVFVVVFNIVFWWLIFFRICLPVPKSVLPE